MNIEQVIRRFLLMLWFAGTICQRPFAQYNKEIDSLMNVLKTAVDDTNKVNTLNNLSTQLLLLAIDKYRPEAKKNSEEALSLAVKLNFKKGIIDSYHRIGKIYGIQGNKTEAMKNHQAALK